MKVLALLLLCAAVGVQARSAGQKTDVALGEYPWLVHLRVAIATGGVLTTGAGVLISDQWVLTSADAVDDARFIWIRYAATKVISPGLVTETSAVRFSAGALALVNANRQVTDDLYISAAALVGASLPETASLALYGASEYNVPGEVLQVISVTLESRGDSIVATSDEGKATQFDSGAPLVNEGVVLGVLTQAGDDDKAAVFTKVSGYLDWIQEETGIVLNSEEDEEEEEEQSYKVNFVN